MHYSDGADFDAETFVLTFDASTLSLQCVSVIILEDALDEPDESFLVRLIFSPLGAEYMSPISSLVTITDNGTLVQAACLYHHDNYDRCP